METLACSTYYLQLSEHQHDEQELLVKNLKEKNRDAERRRVCLRLAGLGQEWVQENQREQILEESREPPTIAFIFPEQIKEIAFILHIVESP